MKRSASLLLESTDGGKWVQALRVGKWRHPSGDGHFEITNEVIHDLEKNFRAGVKGPEVPLRLHHDDKDGKGWVIDLEARAGGAELWAKIDPTDPGVAAMIADRTLKYVSSELDLEWSNPEVGRPGYAAPIAVFDGLALTDRPYVKGMAPIQLSEGEEGFAPYELQQDGDGGDRPESEAARNDLSGGRAPLRLEEPGHDLTHNQMLQLEELQLEVDRLKAEKAARLRKDVAARIIRLAETKRVVPAVANRLKTLLADGCGGSAVIRLATPLKRSVLNLAEPDASDANGTEDEADLVEALLAALEEAPGEETAKVELTEADEDDEDGATQASDKVSLAEKRTRARVNADKKLDYGTVYLEELGRAGVDRIVKEAKK